MDERRVVQVIARGGVSDDELRLGSGYMTHDGVVLTAAHVVERAQTVTVRRVLGPGEFAQAAAEIAWIDSRGSTDLAVLHITVEDPRSAAFPVDLPPVHFGRIVGPAACEAVGFPLFKLRSSAPGQPPERRAYRDTHHARGTTTPLSDRYSGTLEVTVEPPREDPGPQASPWAGMSGAAVFADGALVGVVCEHHRSEGANRITARQVERWYALDPDALAALRAVTGLPEPDGLERVGAIEAGDGYWLGCPYLGLVPYRAQDKTVFYGREKMTERLQQRIVLDYATRGGLLVVTGPSGAGKSSLLNAGLVPALNAGATPEQSRRWVCRVMTPTGHPLRELALVLADVIGRPARELDEMLSLDPARAGQLVAEALSRRAVEQGGPGESSRRQRLVLVVDQIEELFTRLSADQVGKQERAAFVAALQSLTVHQERWSGTVPGIVVVSVRGDFADRLLEFDTLAAAYEAGPFVVRPMTQAELRRAVTGPATEAGLSVEPGLVDEVVRKAHERPDTLALESGVLPMVSEVMARTWERRQGNRLTLRAYQRAGGLENAVEQAADEVLETLSPELCEVARAVFLHLTLVTVDGRIVRRAVTRAELHQDTAGTPQQIDDVVERFVARRLLVAVERDRLQIAHEVLPSSWSTLQGWLDGDRVDQAVRGQLLTDALAWTQHEQAPSYLYPGSRLVEVADVQARLQAGPRRYPLLPADAVSFLEAGHGAERRRVARRRGVIAGLLALSLAASGAAVFAGISADRARHDEAAVRAEATVALSRQLAAEALNLDATSPYTARQLAAAAWMTSPTDEAGQTAATLLSAQPGIIYTPESQIQPMQAVSFDPAGTLLAAADLGGTVHLWSLSTGHQFGTTSTTVTDDGSFDASANGVDGVAFNSAGTVLATADADGTVRMWDPATRKQIGTAINAAGVVHGVSFNSSGTVLATAEDGTVKLWNPVTRKQIGTTIAVSNSADSSVSGIAFNSSGTILATGDTDGTAKLWNPATRQQIGTTIAADTYSEVGGFQGSHGVNGVAFNSAGTVLATADDDGTAKLWDPATQQQIGTTTSTDSVPVTNTTFNPVDGVTFNPAGTVLATADSDGTVSLWDPAAQRQIDSATTIPTAATNNHIPGNTFGGVGIAFNPAGTVLATADPDGTASVWDPAAQQLTRRTITPTTDSFPVLGNTVWDVAFNPAGSVLATGESGQDGTVKLWNPATLKQIGKTITATTDGAPVKGVAFNPAGTVLATAAKDGTVKLWNPATQKQIGTTIHAVPNDSIGVSGVAFNPAGTVLATADSDGTVKLWDPATQKQIGTTIHAIPNDGTGFNPVYSVAFNPAGTVLATAGSDGTVKLWNPATQKQIGTTITVASPSSGGVNSVAFNASGDILATGDSDGTARLWNPATQQQIGTTTFTDTGPVNGVAFNPASTVLAISDNEKSIDLINLSRLIDAGPILCQEYALPSPSTWSRYAGSAYTEPEKCS